MKNKKLLGLFLSAFVFATSLVSCDISSFFENIDEELGFNNSLSDEINVEELTKQEQIYELAKAAGYQGSYEQWLNSIKGKDGEDGKDGLTPEFRVENGMLQWKYTTSYTWIDLYDLGSLKDNMTPSEKPSVDETSSSVTPEMIPLISYEEFLIEASNSTNNVYGMYGTVITTYKSGVYFKSEDGGYVYAYAPEIGVICNQEILYNLFPVGSYIYVEGKPSNYYGAPQFSKGCTIKNIMTNQNYSIEYTDLTNIFASVESSNDPKLSPFIYNTVSLEVTFTTINSDNSYYYFTVGDSSVEYYFRPSIAYSNFMNFNFEDLIQSFNCDKWETGQKAIIKGLVNKYNNIYYIVPIELNAVELI